MNDMDLNVLAEKISKIVVQSQEKLIDERFKNVVPATVCLEKMHQLETKINRPFWVFLGVCVTCSGIGTAVGTAVGLYIRARGII